MEIKDYTIDSRGNWICECNCGEDVVLDTHGIESDSGIIDNCDNCGCTIQAKNDGTYIVNCE